MRALRDAALGYADRGWKVLPLKPGGKAPLGALVPHGKDDATSDLGAVLTWWRRVPRANVGLSCGPSGFVVLDVDPRNGGDDHLHELERELGRLPETVQAETGGGGAHYLFRHPGGQLVGKLAPQGVPLADAGVDVKDAGYIVAPPSTHPSGGRYEWDLGPDDVPMAELPDVWLDRLRPAPALARRDDLQVNVDHADPLRRIPAAVYVPRLTRRDVDSGGWACCPFHGGGQEQAPSLNVKGTLWACYGCPAPAGKRVQGGNIYDLAGMLLDLPLPLRGPDFLDVQARLLRAFA